MRTFFIFFLLLAASAEAITITPAKISGQKELTVTNNLLIAADYSVSGGCAIVDKTSFSLGASQKQTIKVTPTCQGYLEVTEETDTSVNKMRLPISFISKVNNSKRSNALIIVASVSLVALFLFIFRGPIKRGFKPRKWRKIYIVFKTTLMKLK